MSQCLIILIVLYDASSEIAGYQTRLEDPLSWPSGLQKESFFFKNVQTNQLCQRRQLQVLVLEIWVTYFEQSAPVLRRLFVRKYICINSYLARHGLSSAIHARSPQNFVEKQFCARSRSSSLLRFRLLLLSSWNPITSAILARILRGANFMTRRTVLVEILPKRVIFQSFSAQCDRLLESLLCRNFTDVSGFFRVALSTVKVVESVSERCVA